MVAGVGGGLIAGSRHASYRLRLAEGFLAEARQDADLGRWRSAVDSAQLAVENAGKAVLAAFGRVGRTHNPATQIRGLIEEKQPGTPSSEDLERIAELAELLGPDIHIQTDYGDEAGGRTPWELFSEDDARRALDIATEAVNLAGEIIDRDLPQTEGE